MMRKIKREIREEIEPRQILRYLCGLMFKSKFMKTAKLLLIGAASWSLGLTSSLAQFNSGSTGADGALNVTANTTLDLPAGGILNFTIIDVAAGATLRFNPNALNTPVHLLATGDVTIAGIIDVSGSDPPLTSGGPGGLGGPGGFKGGEPGISASSIPPGAGQGPGAGRGRTGSTPQASAGAGAFGGPAGSASTNRGSVYGTPLLIPLIGGSGGGGDDGNPGFAGGGGGGAILIASSTRIQCTGQILAVGGVRQNTFGGGSGGAIRLVAPEVSGTGALDVRSRAGTLAGHGRIRIDALNRSGARFNFLPITAATLGMAMVAIPSPLPRLDLIQVAGTSIAEGTSQPVMITLPFGSSAERTVVVQARDFNAAVPIQVVLTPERGQPSTVQSVIDNRTANPAQTTVNVTFLTNVPTAVHVFTR